MKTTTWLTPLCVAALGLAAGCSTSATNPTGSPGTASGTAATAAPSGTASAWVRGTHAVLTNSTGSTMQGQLQAAVYSNAPKESYTGLANGASMSATQAWNTSGTDVFGRFKYPDGKVIEFTLYNYAVGTPAAEVRNGPDTTEFDPGDPGFQTHDFGENASWTPTVNGHKFTITRNGDDSDNKNWTVTLTTVS